MSTCGATTQTCVHGSVLVVAGGGGGYLVPPQQLSNAEVPGGHAHGAWDEAAVARAGGGERDRDAVHGTRGQWSQTHGTALARGRGVGRRPALWQAACLRPKSTAPVTAAEGEGGGGGQELYTQTRPLEVRVRPCVSPRLGTWSSLLRHMDGPLDTNSAAAHPLIHNPPPPRPQRGGVGGGTWAEDAPQKRRGPSRAVHGT